MAHASTKPRGRSPRGGSGAHGSRHDRLHIRLHRARGKGPAPVNLACVAIDRQRRSLEPRARDVDAFRHARAPNAIRVRVGTGWRSRRHAYGRLLRRAPTQTSWRDAACSYALQAPRTRRRDARMQKGAARRHGAASPKAPRPASGKRASPPDASARATPLGETVRRPRERTAPGAASSLWFDQRRTAVEHARHAATRVVSKIARISELDSVEHDRSARRVGASCIRAQLQ